jgi:hypothetical protein
MMSNGKKKKKKPNKQYACDLEKDKYQKNTPYKLEVADSKEAEEGHPELLFFLIL